MCSRKKHSLLQAKNAESKRFVFKKKHRFKSKQTLSQQDTHSRDNMGSKQQASKEAKDIETIQGAWA